MPAKLRKGKAAQKYETEEEVDIVTVSAKDGGDIEIEKKSTVTTKTDTVLTTKSVPAVPATTTVESAAPVPTTSSESSTQEASQLLQYFDKMTI